MLLKEFWIFSDGNEIESLWELRASGRGLENAGAQLDCCNATSLPTFSTMFEQQGVHTTLEVNAEDTSPNGLTNSTLWHLTGKSLWNSAATCAARDGGAASSAADSSFASSNSAAHCKRAALRSFVLAGRLLPFHQDRSLRVHAHILQDSSVAAALIGLSNAGSNEAGDGGSGWVDKREQNERVDQKREAMISPTSSSVLAAPLGKAISSAR